MKTKRRLKRWVKVVLTIIIFSILLVFANKLLTIESENSIKKCVIVGNEYNYCSYNAVR